MRSLSEPTMPGRIDVSAARRAVLVRLPLWPSTNWWSAVLRYTGWAFSHELEPVVE